MTNQEYMNKENEMSFTIKGISLKFFNDGLRLNIVDMKKPSTFLSYVQFQHFVRDNWDFENMNIKNEKYEYPIYHGNEFLNWLSRELIYQTQKELSQ